MADFQITSWRDLPSMVTARDGDDVQKVQLAPRLQEAIDEAAMRLGDVGSDAYLAGWTRGEWIAHDGTPTEVAERIGRTLEEEWTDERIATYLDGLTP